ncbi:GDSL-type esterase/lipase family protein [Rudanella lutea]|uniref:GDSL-type esterase/lipase family protein n=1 Tax=Rudanella lutea TaxID=451374 RepID=UPI000381FED3|nr:GDSL-type esterase/lipase family protein [Rudanella lutea]
MRTNQNLTAYFSPIIALLWLAYFPTGVWAQTNKFEAEVAKFEETDRQTPPPTKAVVFTGSSSIRLWENLSDYFPGHTLLQRGFGGSELSDVRHFADRLIIRYKPKQVVVYAGENDIAAGATAEQTYNRLVDLFQYVRKALPRAQFTFISIKPSPSRRQYRPVVDATNERIRLFLRQQRRADFVDIVPVMIQANGEPKGELFKSDSLHMNTKGYELWGQVLRPFVQ